jgi:ribonuclease HI
VTTITQVVEHGWLPDHWSAQQAELYSLTRALTIADRRRANIYTDLHYAFATLHIHWAIYKERGLLTSGGKEIKNSQQILQLLEAVWKPRAIAVIHCLAHTNWPDKISQGNGLVDRPAIKAALLEEVQKEDATSAKVCFALPVLPDQPEYSSQKKEQAHKTGAKENSEGMILIPEKAATGLVRLAHDIIHLCKTSLQGLLQKYLVIPQLATLTQLASKACLCYTQHNPGQGPKLLLLLQKKGVYPF